MFWPKDNLKGFGRHEDSIINGRGENPAVIKRDYELMKWVNANSFHTSHYPYSEENLRMADREGFLVIDECAARGLYVQPKEPRETNFTRFFLVTLNDSH